MVCRLASPCGRGLISWLTFCVLYTTAFSNFRWSILFYLFFTYFPNSFFRLFSSHAFPAVSVSSQLGRNVKASRPKWPRSQNFGLGLEAMASVSALALSIWPRPGLGLLVPLPSSHLGLLTDWLVSTPQNPRLLGLCFVHSQNVQKKNTNVSLCKWQKVRWFQPKNAPEAFGSRAPPGPADGGAYNSASPDVLAGFKG